MEFSTSDNDNDASDGNCAATYGGGNWWAACGSNNINGKYGDKGEIGGQFMYWWSFDSNWWHFETNNHYNSLKSMTLMFRQAV